MPSDLKGYDLLDLIGKNNLKSNDNYKVVVEAKDGFRVNMTMKDLTEAYWFKDHTKGSKQPVKPMIAKYNAVLVDVPIGKFNPPTEWEDRDITEDDLETSFPRLVYGQKDVDDQNGTDWIKDVVKITIEAVEELPIEGRTVKLVSKIDDIKVN